MDVFELGLIRRGDDGHLYAMFMAPDYDSHTQQMGRIIAYTAHYIGNNPKAPKYINSPNSAVYAKGECLFGIDRASRERSAEYFIIVEGRLTCCVCSPSAMTTMYGWPR